MSPDQPKPDQPSPKQLRPAHWSWFYKDAAIEVVAIRCMTDNYAYLIVDVGAKRAVVVDPGEAAPVLGELEARGLALESVWLTHHHFDHIGGVDALASRFPNIKVFGSQYDVEAQRLPKGATSWATNTTLTFADTAFKSIEVPGHTLGAIAIVSPWFVMTGDTLFLGGCGRLFEGTADVMWRSLETLMTLPPDTQIFPGHEYTLANLRFGEKVLSEATEKNGTALRSAVGARLARDVAKDCTLPGTLAEELASNVFLLARHAEEPAARFAHLRTLKDHA